MFSAKHLWDKPRWDRHLLAQRPGHPAQPVRAYRMLSLGVAGTLAVSVALVAGPVHAVETYPRPYTSTITLRGHGYGHGSGMSQWGAYGAAKVGRLSWQKILAFYYPGTSLKNLGNPKIRVRLDSVGSGTLNVLNTPGLKLAGRALPTKTAGVTQYRARSLPAAGRMQVDKLTSAGWKPHAATGSPAVFSSSSGLVNVRLASGSRRVYRGSINAHRATSTKVSTVSVLPMESYLRAVVPAEMPASWHPNAVRAQAVAARSYANYDRAHATAGRAWDTCDTTSCQMYSGVAAEYPASNKAVAATAGQTLTYRGASAFTQFGASNGGWSAAGSRAYLASRADPYDGAIPNSANTWTASITAARIQARWPSIGTYRQLRIIRRDGRGQWGGRVLTAVIVGSKGSVSVTGATIRFAFGLRSEWFVPTNRRSAPSYPRDFSGDRKADILGVVARTGAVRLFPGNGAGRWTKSRVVGTGFRGFSKVFTAGTWTSDALSDVMAQKRDGSLWLYPGTRTGSLGPPRKIGAGWGVYNLVFPVGDFNGDGLTDLMARWPDGRLTLYPGNGTGGFLRHRVFSKGWNRFTSILGPGDFNGDGKSDVIARSAGGLLYLYPGNGSGGWLPRRVIGQGWNNFSAISSPGDFNGDGKSDLLARRKNGTLWLYPGNGKGGFLRPKAIGPGWNAFSTLLR